MYSLTAHLPRLRSSVSRTGPQLYCAWLTGAGHHECHVSRHAHHDLVTLREPPQVSTGARYRTTVRIPLVCTLVLFAGCARGATLPEAAGRLASDTRGVLDDSARRLGVPGAHPTILFDDRRPCPHGDARQVVRGSVPLRHGPDPRADLDNAADVSIGLARARGYRLEGPPATDRDARVFTMRHDGPDVRLAVRLHGGRHAFMRIDSTTPCLPGH